MNEQLTMQTLRVERLLLLDRDGNSRAELYTGDDGTPAFVMTDSIGTERLFVGLNTQGEACVSIDSASGVSRVMLRLEDGSPELRLNGADGKLRAVAYVDEERPAIIMYGDGERARFQMYLEQNGRPCIRFLDEAEQPVVSMSPPCDDEPLN